MFPNAMFPRPTFPEPGFPSLHSSLVTDLPEAVSATIEEVEGDVAPDLTWIEDA